MRDLDIVTVRELFPIKTLLTFSGIDDLQAQKEFLLIFVNFTGHTVYSMAELRIAFIRELIEIFFLEGTSEQKHWIFSILHNLATLVSREELAELATLEILEISFDHFMLMDGIMDERLFQSLAVYVELDLDIPWFDLSLLVDYLGDIDGPLRHRVQEVVNLIDEAAQGIQE
jgi:hypothetical protein